MSGNDAATPLASGPSVAAAEVRPTTRAVVTAMRKGMSHQPALAAETANEAARKQPKNEREARRPRRRAEGQAGGPPPPAPSPRPRRRGLRRRAQPPRPGAPAPHSQGKRRPATRRPRSIRRRPEPRTPGPARWRGTPTPGRMSAAGRPASRRPRRPSACAASEAASTTSGVTMSLIANRDMGPALRTFVASEKVRLGGASRPGDRMTAFLRSADLN